MHRLLERQIKRILDLESGQFKDLLQNHAEQIAGQEPDLARALFALPALLERVTATYDQQERDLVLIRRSLDLSSQELSASNQKLREEAQATTQALAALQRAFDILRKDSNQGDGIRSNDLVVMAEQVAALTRERERIQDARVQSEERFDLAMRGANDGLWDYDVVRGAVYFSPRWKSMIGYHESEIGVSLNEWTDRVHPDDLSTASEALQTHFHGNTPQFEATFRFLHKQGHYLWILSRAQALKDACGMVTRIVGTHTDITQQKQAEEALFKEKELAQVTLASIADSVLTTDALARITFLNPVAEQLTGWTLNEAKGLHVSEIIQLVNEAGEMQENPAMLCCLEQRVVDKESQALLVSRHGGKHAIESSAAPIWSSEGKLSGVVMVFQDVTEKRALTQDMAWQVAHDSLTGLNNRREFEQRLRLLLLKKNEKNCGHAMLYIDLDQFKLVNDTCGHLAGDELLKSLAHQLQTHVRSSDTLARLGGDEFGLLLENCPIAKAKEIAENLRGIVHDFRFAWQDKSFEIGVSIGVAPIDLTTGNIEEVMAAADMACYAAKERGRNRTHVYTPDDQELVRRRAELHAASGIRAALEQSRLTLYAQEIRPMRGGLPPHYEILLRMVGEDGHLQPPSVFIPAAERYGLMAAVDKWVIKHAFAFMARTPGLELAINLSGLSLQDEGFIKYVRTQLAESGIDALQVCFEITETAAISNLTRATSFMQEMKALGFRFSLDDFGAGMSSFTYLKHLPVDYLKIDGAFVRDIVTDLTDRAFVETINRISHVMGKQTIAEFVENSAIIRELSAIGVDYIQGYGVARPVPLESLVLPPGEINRHTPVRLAFPKVAHNRHG